MSLAATLLLLRASVLVAVSGGFKLYVAFLLLGAEPRAVLCAAFTLLVYAVYTMDRALGCREDAVNRGEFEQAHRGCGLLAACLSFAASLLVLLWIGVLPVAAFFPLAAGLMYSRGARIAGASLRLKGGLGVKNLTVAFTWAFTIAAFLYPWAGSIAELVMVFVFFFVKSFINTVIYDCRDARGDALAGLVTLPVFLGMSKTRAFLHGLHAALHLCLAALVLLGFIEFQPVILVYSGGAGFLYISLYANGRRAVLRDLLVDGEWVLAVVFRNTYQFSRSAFYSS